MNGQRRSCFVRPACAQADVRAQINKRLKETLRSQISSVTFKFFWPKQGNLLGIRIIRELEKMT